MAETEKPIEDESTQRSTRWGGRRAEPDAGHPLVDVARTPLPGARYRAVGLLGRGGMGEVTLVEDRRIGRLVACKSIPKDLDVGTSLRARFVREARVQGQLEHPSIVPVYDIDKDADGVEYFTMKRISGLTLAEVMKGLRAGDEELRARFTQGRLLAIFQQVCLAMDYAHQRGIIHRDLKPTNVMVGDFGEVYVLDWGIAKIGSAPESRASLPESLGGETEDSTQAHDMLGTPGYLAPEQIRNAAEVDARADVFSLGALLFHMLALEPMLTPGSADAVSRASSGDFDARPSERAPDLGVAPELDLVCVRATAHDPDQRFQSARALHDAVEAFLEGRRDVQLRRQLADRYAADARAVLGARGALDAAARGEALRHAGHALALDPTHEEAAQVIARLLLEPPAEIPKEVEEQLEATQNEVVVRTLRAIAVQLFAFLGLVFLLYWGGMRNPLAYAAIFGPLTVAAGLAASIRRVPKRHAGLALVTLGACVALAIGASAGVFGPFVVTPVFAIGLVVVASSLPAYDRLRAIVGALGFLSAMVPILGEWVGLFPPMYEFVDGNLVVHQGFMPFRELPVRVGLSLTIGVSLALVGMIGWRLSREVARMQRKMQLHAFHLRQILPASVPKESEDSEG